MTYYTDITIKPENYDLIYRAIDLKIAYEIVQDYVDLLAESDDWKREKIMKEAMEYRMNGQAAVVERNLEAVDLHIRQLCDLAAKFVPR